jgi:glycosyltransferase involved in cell wall biosynthesis
VTLIAPVDTTFQERGIKVLPVGSWASRYYRFFVVIPRLLFKALKVRASLYHFHDPELLIIVPFLRLSGAKVIYDIHEDYVTSIQQKRYIPGFFRNLIAKTFGTIERMASSLCYKVIAEKYYKERFPDAVEILNYPLLKQQSEGVASSVAPEQDAIFDDCYQWFLYTGNVTIDRGALLQLELLKVHKDTAIAYIGKCSEELADAIYASAEREKISRERVRIIGIGAYVPREIIDYYTYTQHWLAGVALFPETHHYMRKELTKFFEYMEAGLPILCSDFPVWRNIVENNNCGFTVNSAEQQSLVSAIEYLLAHPENAIKMGDNGRQAVSMEYNWGAEEKKLLDLYHRVIG